MQGQDLEVLTVAAKLYKASQLKTPGFFDLSSHSELTPHSFPIAQSKIAETETFWACLKACEESEYPISLLHAEF